MRCKAMRCTAMGRRTKFWLAVAVQLAVLLGMVGLHGYTLATGQPVLLKTAPVDPWDLMRGQYVRLAYEITTLDAGKVTVTGSPRQADRVWVTLRKGAAYWDAVAIGPARPALGPGEVAIRGRVMAIWTGPLATGPLAMGPMATGPMAMGRTVPASPLAKGEQSKRFVVRYGIEQFYVPEGEGQKLEGRRAALDVEVAVDSRGRAALRRVLVDGKPITWR
jgi:uncharacterized membrane-anchored protein